MKTYDLIFSNQTGYRISRHVLFWLCWFLFMVLVYQIPMSDVFPNWNIKARMEYSQKINGVDFITLRGGLVNMIWEISYKQFRILLCHMAFTYAVIYYILPLYISNSKKWIITTGKLILIFIACLALYYFVIWRGFIDVNAEWARRGITLPSSTFGIIPGNIIRTMSRHILLNLSTLVGVAVAIKLLKRWWLKQKETEQVAKEKLSAELQLLKAQVHPHFLFNSLNNIYSFALEGSPKAPEMIQKLSGLLHYMLYECKQPLVPMDRELKMIQDYISLEKIRYGERLRMEIQIPQEFTPPLKGAINPPTGGEGWERSSGRGLIAPLLLIPFVENSFKHGTSKMLSRPEITLHIIVLENILHFKLTNSRPAGIDEISVNGNRGLGLKNVKKRLALLYPRQHELQIIDDLSSYTVWLKIVLSDAGSPGIKEATIKEIPDYELA